jgi:hypothetical protein
MAHHQHQQRQPQQPQQPQQQRGENTQRNLHQYANSTVLAGNPPYGQQSQDQSSIVVGVDPSHARSGGSVPVYSQTGQGKSTVSLQLPD